MIEVLRPRPMARRCGVLAAAVLLALTACSSATGPAFLADFRPPPGDAPLPDEFWDDVPEKGSSSEYWLWPIPMYVSADATIVDDEGRTLYRVDGNALNLGLLVIPVLPLWADLEVERFTADGQRGRQSVFVSPFWTTSSRSDWPADLPKVEAWGIPLLYTDLRAVGPSGREYVTSRSTLWTLGPALATVDVTVDDERHAGWAFWPIYGAGIGTLLWQSMHVEDDRGGWLIGHGPLASYLGYVSVREIHGPWHHDDNQPVTDTTTRLALGGALWWSRESRDADGRPISAWNGPLWGMLGWGYSDGDFCLRLLWFPIPL